MPSRNSKSNILITLLLDNSSSLPALLLILYVTKVGDYRDIVEVGRIMICCKIITMRKLLVVVSPKAILSSKFLLSFFFVLDTITFVATTYRAKRLMAFTRLIILLAIPFPV